MGLFDDLKKSWDNAKKEAEKQNKEAERDYNLSLKWKEEEKLKFGDKRKVQNNSLTAENVLKYIDIATFAMQKKQIDISLDYGNNSREKRNRLREERSELNSKIDNLKSNNNRNHNDSNLSFEYTSTRNRRIALCISYLANPYATAKCKKIALLAILLTSPNYPTVKEEAVLLNERFNLYKKSVKNFRNESVLDACFLLHLVADAEGVSIDDQDTFAKRLDFFMYCKNEISFFDEYNGLHIGDISFYGLSEEYTPQVKSKEMEIYEYFGKWCAEHPIESY